MRVQQRTRRQTAHCALWPSAGRVGLGSSGNREDQPSPLSHNEGLITGPASLKSHGSRPPVSVLRSPNILIALLFSLCIYCASLPDSLLLSPQPFHTWKRDANCLLWKILGLWLARRRVWLARLCEGASSQQWRGAKNGKLQEIHFSVIHHMRDSQGLKVCGLSLCSSGNLSECNVGGMLMESMPEQNYCKVSCHSRLGRVWSIVVISIDVIIIRPIISPLCSLNIWTTSLGQTELYISN